MYVGSSKNCNAAIFDRKSTNKVFLADTKTYCFFTNNKNEANYICAYLNSRISNILIKPFQTKGLFGERDIHTRILKIPFPEYDESKTSHLKIANIAADIQDFLSSQNFNPNQTAYTRAQLGDLRLKVLNSIHNEISEIDKLLKNLIT